MKPTGLPWVREVPIGWDIIQQKYLMRKTKTICEHYSGEPVLSLTTNGVVIRDVESGKGKFPATFDGYQYIDSGNLVLCLFDIDVTPCCVGLARNHGVISPAYSQFELVDGADARYYNYYLHAIDNQKLYLHLTSTLRSSMTADAFGTIRAPRPPLQEQKRIADYLDYKCTEVDKAIAAAEASIEEYENYLKEATRRLVMGFDGADGGRIDTGIEWLGTIPGHWKLVPFRCVYREISRDGYEDEQLLSVYLNRGVIPYTESDGMQVHKPSESLTKYQLVLPGNLVLNNQQAWRGSVGVSFHKGIISPAYHVFEQLGNELDDRYANLLFRGPWVPCFTVCSTGVGSIQRNVSKVQLKAELVPIPPKSEQKSIADKVEALQHAVSRIIDNKQSILEDLKSYKQSLVYEVVTGKREV